MTLHDINEKKLVEIIVLILPFLFFVYKKGYKSKIEIKKGNQIRNSIMLQKDERKNKVIYN